MMLLYVRVNVIKAKSTYVTLKRRDMKFYKDLHRVIQTVGQSIISCFSIVILLLRSLSNVPLFVEPHVTPASCD